MKNLFLKYGIPLGDGEISKLNAFGSNLKAVNEVMNLTTVTEDREMWIKHFLDSLLGAELFPNGATCLEVGSGGGFPSMPLKIYRGDLKLTLVESTGKKCDYLRDVCDKLDLDGVEVVTARAEELAKDLKYRERYDAVTARAVARLNTLCEYCLPFVRVGGTFIAYKGDAKEELDEAKNAIRLLGGKLKEVKEYELPDGLGMRNIIVIEKTSPTPAKYPRGNGKERKKPL